jgi:hypothetical protein
MTIVFQFSEGDVDSLNTVLEKRQYDRREADQIKDEAQKYLSEMSVSDASVDFVRDSRGVILWGNRRTPLLVTSGDERFVIKSYDRYAQDVEKRILTEVSGIIAPNVKFLGSDFYAEESIDHTKATKLMLIADQGPEGLESALKIGAEMHARLAHKGIDYAHSHWLDEFHLFEDRQMITDFGAARFFVEPGNESEAFKEKLEYIQERGFSEIQKNGFSAYFDYFRLIECFDNFREGYHETNKMLFSLTDDPAEFISLMYLMRSAASGIKSYAMSLPARVEVGLADFPNLKEMGDAWDIALRYLPLFVETFAKEYKALKHGQTA